MSEDLSGLYETHTWRVHGHSRIKPGTVLHLSHEDAKMALEAKTATRVPVEALEETPELESDEASETEDAVTEAEAAGADTTPPPAAESRQMSRKERRAAARAAQDVEPEEK
jgi:hypothetical protein